MSVNSGSTFKLSGSRLVYHATAPNSLSYGFLILDCASEPHTPNVRLQPAHEHRVSLNIILLRPETAPFALSKGLSDKTKQNKSKQVKTGPSILKDSISQTGTRDFSSENDRDMKAFLVS
jgi:hypothetical protein